MTPADSQPSIDSTQVPSGFLEPRHEHARRVLTAMKHQRFDAAARHLAGVAEDSGSDSAWHSFLVGALAAHRHESNDAVAALEDAVSACDGSRDGVRLAAMAWERLGLLHRRREELDRAAFAHDEAYKLRMQHGSPVECWESAHSRAVTDALRENTGASVEWFQIALTAADRILGGAEQSADDSADRCRAVTFSSLADVLTTASRGEEAVAAARSAVACWRRHDFGSEDAARAESRLGRALVKHAEAVLDTAPQIASDALDEAISRLTAAKESLLAFGPAVHADSLWCDDLLDFAVRLRAAF